jgi:hypothetical protein
MQTTSSKTKLSKITIDYRTMRGLPAPNAGSRSKMQHPFPNSSDAQPMDTPTVQRPTGASFCRAVSSPNNNHCYRCCHDPRTSARLDP